MHISPTRLPARHWTRRRRQDVPTLTHMLIQLSDATAAHTRQALDRWEERLEGIFDGRPYDILDAALSDTVSQYPVHIQPFRDMIDGMRMDLVKSRSVCYAVVCPPPWPCVSMHPGCMRPCQCCTALPPCLPRAMA